MMSLFLAEVNSMNLKFYTSYQRVWDRGFLNSDNLYTTPGPLFLSVRIVPAQPPEDDFYHHATE